MADLHGDQVDDLFFEEAAEFIESLSASLVALERGGHDNALVNEAFRAAHSLKGMAAAMGCRALAAVTHALEDVLDAVRAGQLDVQADVIGAMLAASDHATSMLAALAEGGSDDTIDASASIDALAAIAALAANDAGPREEPGERVIAPLPDGARGFEVVIDNDSLMPAARAYAACLVASELGELLRTEPSLEVLEAGQLPGGALMVWIDSTLETTEIAGRLGECSEVAGVRELDAPGDPDTPVADDGDAHLRVALPAADAAPGEHLRRQRTVRVDAQRLDALMHSVGELLVQRARVESRARELEDRELIAAVDVLGRAAQRMQTLVMDVRMVSIDSVFRRLPRMVRDLEHSLDKRVNLTISGGDTELDRTVIDLVGDPLVHLVRNAIDHGIEPPAERERKGKPPEGHIAVSAAAAGGVVLIRVRDDGCGMQPDIVRSRAVSRGLITQRESDAMSDEQALQLCFSPGFSTRDSVSDLSGRGVGLDVVRSSVRQLGGDVLVDSSDEGTLMTIKLPLTLAIVPVLLVRAAGDTYGLPTSRVRATLDMRHVEAGNVHGRMVVTFHDRLVPAERLDVLLGLAPPGPPPDDGHVVVVEGADTLIAVIVGSVVMQQEVVTRALPTTLGASDLLSAGAMLGDGTIALLLDTELIAERIGKVTRAQSPVA